MADSDDILEIPVTFQGEDLVFPARVLLSGYTHKIQVEVFGQSISFEPDEERNYRAVLDAAQLDKNTKVDVALLQIIATVLESALK